nr:hypothetical protein [Tanacetum cinerariifolium]
MTDSGHSTVSYTLISSPERSWDIPDVDPYEEVAIQAIEQVALPLSPAYLPDPIKLDEHVPVYVPKREYPKYLEPPADDIVTEDQPHADDAVPTALSLGYIADLDPKEDPDEEENVDYANEPEEGDPEEEDLEEEESDDKSASKEDPLEGSDDTKLSEEDETAVTPPPSRLRGRLCFATPTTKFEVGESLAAAARPPRDLYGFVDTTTAEASITRRHAKTLHDTKNKMMTTVELVNMRVSYEAQTCQRDGEEFHLQLRDAQRNHTDIRVKIVALKDQGTLLEYAYIELHEDLLRSEASNELLEAHNRSLVTRIETIETHMI